MTRTETRFARFLELLSGSCWANASAVSGGTSYCDVFICNRTGERAWETSARRQLKPMFAARPTR